MQDSPADLSTATTLIGCCGWGEGKAKYYTRFETVELQTTFYEPPSVELALKWRAEAPRHFRFCMKAWQLITHTPSSPTYRRLKSKLSVGEHELVGSFRRTEQVLLAWERTASVARALDASMVLFQCPTSFHPTRENISNLRSFFSEISRPTAKLAWEPRGEWPDELVGNLCRDLDLVHCVDPFKRESIGGPFTYWRLHGRTGYSYRYSEDELVELESMLLARIEAGCAPNYVFFNNVWMREDASRFQALLGRPAQA